MPSSRQSGDGQPPTTAGYSGTPLVKKLGIAPNSVLCLLNAPAGFEKTLGPLPDNVTVRTQARGRRELTIWFPANATELKRRIGSLATNLGDGALWIAWPKKSSGVETDLSDQHVRQSGLQQGIVDYKVCAIDQTWSGLKFVHRRT